MGHLTTIICRFFKRFKVYNNDPEKAKKDDLWLQVIANLQEYVTYWSSENFTDEEWNNAKELWDEYKVYLKNVPHYREIMDQLGWEFNKGSEKTYKIIPK